MARRESLALGVELMRAALLVVCLATRAIAAPTTVAVDVSHLERADASAIEQALIARLVQEGFAVVQLASAPAVVLVVTARGNELVVTARTKTFEHARAIDAASGSGSQLQLELAQKGTELARLAAETIPPEKIVPFVLKTDEPSQPPPPERRWLVGVEGGALSRGGGTDAELGVRARLGIWRDIGIALLASGSTSAAGGVSVRELSALVGVSNDWALRGALRGELAVFGGIRQHHFESSMAIAEPTGDRIDPAVVLRARLGLSILRVLEISLWGGITLSQARTHVLGTQVLWQREGTGIGVGLGVAFRF